MNIAIVPIALFLRKFLSSPIEALSTGEIVGSFNGGSSCEQERLRSKKTLPVPLLGFFARLLQSKPRVSFVGSEVLLHMTKVSQVE